MAFYLCERCAKERVRVDLTLAGFNQLWVRTSPNPVGFGHPCAVCSEAMTVYQAQVIGTEKDTEETHLTAMKAALLLKKLKAP